jgi:antitoxin component YwqK of YwqJK toxin-antitoxin module
VIQPPEGYSGRWVDWYPNGEKVQTQYVRGVKHGQRIVWGANGVVAAVESYRGGKLNGGSVAWHSNGQPVVVKTFVNDVPNGVFSRWSLDGDLREIVEYRQGREVGRWPSWSEYRRGLQPGKGSADVPDE